MSDVAATVPVSTSTATSTVQQLQEAAAAAAEAERVRKVTVQQRLSEWERLAPLSFQQRDAALEIAQAAQRAPLPHNLLPGDADFSHNVAVQEAAKEESDREKPTCFEKLLLGETRIESAQQFLSWYSEVEVEMAKEEDVHHQAYVNRLNAHSDECLTLLNQVETSLAELSKLGEQYRFVSNKTNSLHEACEHLLEDQARLNSTAEAVEFQLSYFTELDRLTQQLNSPVMSVTSESFAPMLDKIDACIAHMAANPKYKEAPAYLARLKSCLNRALAMVRQYVINTLRTASQHTESEPADASFSLYYGRFRQCAPKMKVLMTQMERRRGIPEYDSLLSECHNFYVNLREELLSASVALTVGDLASTHRRDHCTLVRSGCAFLVRLCEDEHQLYLQFFSVASPPLTSFLETLCLQLYDALRPSIIHVDHLETLAELCAILRLETTGVASGPLEAFERVASQLLQDVQERLVYRTHIYIQTDILRYRPAPGDLAYPEKLEMMESIAESLQQQGSSSAASSTSDEVAQITGGVAEVATPTSPADLHGMWYPPVRRTLVCLSKLYRCLDRSICQGLAQEALTACVQSVADASQAISKRKTPLDGHLFLIKHLLIVREQIAPFHVDFSVRETSLDFSRVRSAAAGLVQKRGRLFSLSGNNSLLEFLLEGTPQVVEYCRDSKKEVDRHLKQSCESFVDRASKGLLGPLPGFLSKCQVVLNLGVEREPKEEERKDGVKLSEQPFATAQQVATTVSDSLRCLKSGLPPLRRSMQLYLANRETEFVLFRPVKNGILTAFVQLQALVKQHYTPEEQTIVACPTQEQVSVLVSSIVSRSECSIDEKA